MAFFPRDVAAPAPAPRASIQWEEAACVLCGRRDWTAILEAPDWRAGKEGRWFAVVQCAECGCCFTNPRPAPDSMSQFYAGDYKPHHPPRGNKIRKRRRWLPGRSRPSLPLNRPGRLLDFGCGNGSFLERMQQQGWQVTGLDMHIPDELAHRARGRYPVLAGSLPHADLGPRTFDLITMWQSLEHVHDPLAVLHETHRLLVPGGQLLITVPNLASAPFTWFGPAWNALDLPRHLTHFTPVTLHRMLQRAGFQVASIQMIRHTSWIRASARLVQQSPRRKFWQRLLRGRLAAGLAAWYAYLTFQSDSMLVTAFSRPDQGFV